MTRLLRATPGHAAPVIVAPLDGSAPGRCTTALAAGLIRRMGWRLTLVPVPLRVTAADRRRRLIAAALDERAALIARPATHRESAADQATDCLALAACAPCPVLAVPLAGGREPALNGPVICGIDGSDSSARVARAATGLAIALGAALELVHVATPRENGAVSSVDLPPVEVVVESGDPAGRLCALAESKRGLLVIGAPARGNTDGKGRTAATVLAEARVPVAVVSSSGIATATAESGAALDEVAA
jgi:nucleotide-binding universal stress UspA family protein